MKDQTKENFYQELLDVCQQYGSTNDYIEEHLQDVVNTIIDNANS